MNIATCPDAEFSSLSVFLFWHDFFANVVAGAMVITA
jgi:hypothetical protein